MERVQTLVLGAGVIGLSCARALARLGREVVLCDLGGAVGAGTSSRNSEVIHAGLYYPQGSRKAKHCLRGSEMLRRFCLEREVPHRICGKLIVATSEAQLPELKALEMKAAGNGVKLEPLSPQQVQQMEPEVGHYPSHMNPPRSTAWKLCILPGLVSWTPMLSCRRCWQMPRSMVPLWRYAHSCEVARSTKKV